jgi:hypothetical protein
MAIVMTDPDRDAVIMHDRNRKALRELLLTDAKMARHDLHPKALAARWMTRQKKRLAEAGSAAQQQVAKNAPLIGIGAAAILLFAVRKPISKWLNGLGNRWANKEGEE